MKLQLHTFLFLAVSVLAAPAYGQTAKEDFSKLEGTWIGGVRAPAGKAKTSSATMVQISELTIKGGKVTACKDGKGLNLGNCDSLALNPTAKTMDAAGSTKDHKGVFQGIYRVNGDKLEWCAANPGIARPKDFFTTPQVQFHMVFNRKKP